MRITQHVDCGTPDESVIADDPSVYRTIEAFRADLDVTADRAYRLRANVALADALRRSAGRHSVTFVVRNGPHPIRHRDTYSVQP